MRTLLSTSFSLSFLPLSFSNCIFYLPALSFFNFIFLLSFFFTPTPCACVCVCVCVQVERALELVRSGLKAVIEINKLEDISLNRRWLEFTDRLTSPTSSTADIYRSLTLGLDRGLDM